MISEFVEYVKQAWKNKPNVSSPLNADRLNHMEAGIENNSKKIKETVTAVNELTENNTLKIKEGTGVNVIYNDTVVILEFRAPGLTIESDKINTQIALSKGIVPATELYFVMPMMTSNWYPLNRNVYFTFLKNNKNPKTRLVTGTTSESNVVVAGYVTFPRGYFSITD